MSFIKQIRELWDHLRGKGPAAAVSLTLDLGDARDNKPYMLEAGGVIVERCDGDLYARINGPNGDGINLRYVRRVSYPIVGLFLTNTVQAGKSARLILLPTGMEADCPDVKCIIAGTNITLDPTTGVGEVTINAAAGAGDHYAMFLDYPFCQLWYANLNVVGSVTQRGFRADVYTSATYLTSRVYSSVGVLIASKEPKFQVEFAISPTLISGTIVTVGLTYASDPRLASGSIGLEYEYPTLYAFSSDGTTRSRLALAFTMDTTYHTYRQILQAGVGLRTWIDGVEKETKITNLPTTQDIGTWNCQIIATSSGLYLYVMFPRIIWKP